MKQTCFLLAFALLVPTTALAQAGDDAEDAPGEAQPAQTGDQPGASDEGEAAEGEETTEGEEEAAEGAEAEGAETAEPQAEEQPAADPEPEVSATAAAETEAEIGLSSPDRPSLADDLAAAETEANEPAVEEEEEDVLAEDEGPKLPWRNSLFLYDNEVSTYTLDGGASGISPNPYWAMAFSFRPRWYFTDEISLRLRQDLSVELTDTDSEVKNRRPVLADTILDVVHGNLLEVEGARLTAGGRLSFPTSIASRSYSKYFTAGANFAVSRPFEDVLEGFDVGLNGSYSYTFAGSNVRTIEGDPDDFAQSRAAANPSGLDVAGPGELPAPQASGVTVADHAWTVGLAASLMPIENLSFETTFTWWWTHGRDATTGCVPTLTSPEGCEVVPDTSDTHTRLSTWFTLGASYQVLDWLGTSLTYSHLTGEFDPDATRRNPFWSVDSTVSLTASVTLDKLYQNFSGTGSSPGEVVEDESRDNNSARASAQSVGVAW